jgi:hypothetical protein
MQRQSKPDGAWQQFSVSLKPIYGGRAHLLRTPDPYPITNLVLYENSIRRGRVDGPQWLRSQILKECPFEAGLPKL